MADYVLVVAPSNVRYTYNVCCVSGDHETKHLFLPSGIIITQVLWVKMEHPKRKHDELISYDAVRAKNNPHLQVEVAVETFGLHPNVYTFARVGNIKVVQG